MSVSLVMLFVVELHCSTVFIFGLLKLRSGRVAGFPRWRRFLGRVGHDFCLLIFCDTRASDAHWMFFSIPADAVEAPPKLGSCSLESVSGLM